jgi:hypothetical protein
MHGDAGVTTLSLFLSDKAFSVAIVGAFVYHLLSKILLFALQRELVPPPSGDHHSTLHL